MPLADACRPWGADDLPNRDCNAKASNGEISSNEDGADAAQGRRSSIKGNSTGRVTPRSAAGGTAPADGTAPCLRSVKLLGGALPEPAVTCWCVADDMSQIVCGMSDGTVLLLRTLYAAMGDVLFEHAMKIPPNTQQRLHELIQVRDTTL